MRKQWLTIAGMAAVLLASGCGSSVAPTQAPASKAPAVVTDSTAGIAAVGPPTWAAENVRGPFPVSRVVDGDTIWVQTDSGRLKVRLIGIDTAETVAPGQPVGCFGPEATAEAERLLAGTSVSLELDPSQGAVDRYDRTLAYVWMANGGLFNLAMVRDGFAIEYTYDQPYRYQAQFKSAQAQAQQSLAGMWSQSTCGGDAAFQ